MLDWQRTCRCHQFVTASKTRFSCTCSKVFAMCQHATLLPARPFWLKLCFSVVFCCFDCVWLLGLLLIMSLVRLSRLVRRARSLAQADTDMLT